MAKSNSLDIPKQPDARLRRLEGELEREKRHHDRRRQEVEELKRQLADANGRLNALDVEFKRVSRHSIELNEAMKTTQHQLSFKTRECDEKHNELTTLRSVLTTYDDASAEDVGNLLQDINDRVEEAARDASNKWLFDSLPKPRTVQLQLADCNTQYLTQHLGYPFVELLGKTNVEHDSALFLLQAAWQAIILERVTYILSAFTLPMAGTNTSGVLSAAARLIHAEGAKNFTRVPLRY